MGFFLKFWLDESVRRNVWVSMKNFFLLVENRVFQRIMVHFFNLTFGFEKFARQTKLSSHPGLWEFFYSALNHRHPRVHFFLFCAWSTSTLKYKQGSQRSGKTWKRVFFFKKKVRKNLEKSLKIEKIFWKSGKKFDRCPF